MMARSRLGQKLFDSAAIGASVLCLLHCLALPLLFALLPALAGLVAVPESFHRVALLFAIPASAIALLGGYRRHGLPLPAAIGLIGLALMIWGALGGLALAAETGLTVLGSMMLASCHIWNWRATTALGKGSITP